MSLVAILFAVRADRTPEADVDARESASLLLGATTDTVALSRTASGETLTVPSAVMVMLGSGAAAIVAGASEILPTRDIAVIRTATRFVIVLFMA